MALLLKFIYYLETNPTPDANDHDLRLHVRTSPACNERPARVIDAEPRKAAPGQLSGATCVVIDGHRRQVHRRDKQALIRESARIRAALLETARSASSRFGTPSPGRARSCRASPWSARPFQRLPGGT